MKFRWSVAPRQSTLAASLAQELGIPALLAQCLLNRGFSTCPSIQAFLQPRLRQLADPFLLPNMSVAVERLLQARELKEPVVIFGDYDVDGVTSTALLVEVLRALGWQVRHYLPHRLDEGYGLTPDAVDNCIAGNPVSLLLAVDCGSTAVESAARLRQRDIDVIVLDHHQVSSPAPVVAALVNPLAAADAGSTGHAAPFSELCSAGLAFKLAHALLKRARELGVPGAADLDLKPLLDLVALGTIADMVPLTGENRILVPAGLERLRKDPRPGILALREVAKCGDEIGPYEVGFQLAPRLNAAGRLQTAEQALHLLTSQDSTEALNLARALDACNRERQAIERRIADQAIIAVQSAFDPANDWVVVEGNSQWHIGVVGIVASRLQQQFCRPAIVFGGEGPEWRGSGRSIAGFDLASALRECDDLLVRHGGHAMAAGVSIVPEKLPAFRERLNQVARRMLTPETLAPPLSLDGEISLGEIDLDCMSHLQKLMPVGPGNPAAQFCARKVALSRPVQRIGQDKKHVKMWIADGTATHEVVWWSAGDSPIPEGRFDVAFVPQLNTYKGRTRVQLKLLDWRPALNP